MPSEYLSPDIVSQIEEIVRRVESTTQAQASTIDPGNHTTFGGIRHKVTPTDRRGEVGFPYGDKWVFGLTVSGNTVTVHNPKLRRYGDPQGDKICYESGDVVVTFKGDGDDQRICWKWSVGGGLEILTEAQTNDPLDDGSYIYGVIAVFTVQSSIATLKLAVQCGQIITLPVFTVAGS